MILISQNFLLNLKTISPVSFSWLISSLYSINFLHDTDDKSVYNKNLFGWDNPISSILKTNQKLEYIVCINIQTHTHARNFFLSLSIKRKRKWFLADVIFYLLLLLLVYITHRREMYSILRQQEKKQNTTQNECVYVCISIRTDEPTHCWIYIRVD